MDQEFARGGRGYQQADNRLTIRFGADIDWDVSHGSEAVEVQSTTCWGGGHGK